MSTLYIDRKGVHLRSDGGVIAVYENHERIGTIPIKPLNRVVMRGDVHLHTRLLTEFAQQGIGVLLLTGRKAEPTLLLAKPHQDAKRRITQYRLSLDRDFCLQFSQCIVKSKLLGQSQLMEQLGSKTVTDRYVYKVAKEQIDRVIGQVDMHTEIAGIRGLEGSAAAVYFSALSHAFADRLGFNGRNRQPPKDPVNVILSLGYTLIHAEAVVAIYAAGLDPYIGFYHALQFGRESLACDLMESIRPLYDAVVIEWFKSQILRVEHFSVTEQGCLLGKAGREKFYPLYEDIAHDFRKRLHQDIQSLTQTLRQQDEEPLVSQEGGAIGLADGLTDNITDFID